jgi:hypothetical protein
MKAYQINRRKFLQMIYKREWTPEEELAATVCLQNLIYSPEKFRRAGFTDNDLQQMADNGSIKLVELNHYESISLRLKEKHEVDQEYREHVLDYAKRGREARWKKHDAHQKASKLFKKMAQKRLKEIHKRRKLLLRDIIIPNFGTEDESGYRQPERISVIRLCHLLRTRYRDFAETYYRMRNDHCFNHEVRQDVLTLGIGTLPLSASDGVWSEIMSKRPHKKGLRTGFTKMWEMAERDPELRKVLVERGTKNLLRNAADRKGERKERREALYRHVIEPEFEGLQCKIGVPSLVALLEDEKYEWVKNKYYPQTPESPPLENLLRLDLLKLRRDTGTYYDRKGKPK